MIPNKCPNCGATVNRARAICEYCGTTFEDDAVRVIYDRAKCDTISATVCLGEEWFDRRTIDPNEISEVVLHQLSVKLAEGIVPYMNVRIEHDPVHCLRTFRGDVRVLRPNARF